MNYNETLKYISETPKFSKILGNDELKRLLAHLGNPQDGLRFIHVAGTNGKGSVCAMTARILECAGYKAGLYTSPFINVFNERIQINGENISDADLAEYATLVRGAISEIGVEISEFAQITAMAFLYFRAKNCGYVVLETGLGGTLDATNVISAPAVCAITKIGLDHTKYLGDTVEKIAAEKCGIIKDGAPVVTSAAQCAEALSVIRAECARRGSELTVAAADCGYTLSLTGAYQPQNGAVAAEICRILNIPEEMIIAGLASTHFPARFERLSDNLIIDGAHNPDGAAALAASLSQLGRPVHLVCAMMADKDYRAVCSILAAAAKNITATQVDMPRCLEAGALAAAFRECGAEASAIENPVRAVSDALLKADGEAVCVCGSLFLASEIRKYFLSGEDISANNIKK